MLGEFDRSFDLTPVLDRRTREVLRLKETAGEAPCAHGAAELKRSTQTTVSIGAVHYGLELANRRLRRRQAQAQKFLHLFRNAFGVDELFDFGLLKVVQLHPEPLVQIDAQGFRADGVIKRPFRKFGSLLTEPRFLFFGIAKGGMRQVHIHQHPATINPGIQRLQCAFLLGDVELRQKLEERSFGFNVQAAVVHKPRPIVGVRLSGCTTEFHVLRARLAEKLHQTLTVQVLGVILVELVDRREVGQRAGKPVLVGEHHRVNDVFGLEINDAEVVKHDGVEVHAVVPNAFGLPGLHVVQGLAQVVRHLGRHGRVPHLRGSVADGIAEE